MTQSVSILIPTHNRAEILSLTLQSLRGLKVPDDVRVDLVIVANACTDETEARVKEIAPSLPIPVRCVTEARPGLSVARNRAAREATGNVIAYLDDDVDLEPDWLVGMIEVYRKYPAGLVQGRIYLRFTGERPVWLGAGVQGLLSCLDLGDEVTEYGEAGGYIRGGNLSMTKQIWTELGGFNEDLGRAGGLLLACEEGEFARRAIDAGHRIFYGPKMAFHHRIDPDRATKEYLYKAAFGQGISKIFLKPRFELGVIARATVGHAYLLVRHGVGYVMSLVCGNETKEVFNRVRWNIGLGGLSGVRRRLSGESLVAQTSPRSAER